MIDQILLLGPSVSIRDAIDRLVRGGKKAVFIVDDRRRLLGLFTNGDMRSILLKNTDFEWPVSKVMNKNPIVFSCASEAISYSQKNRKLVIYPIVVNGFLTDAIYDDDARLSQETDSALSDVPLVIFAGGKGTRLYPYTKILPKALIPVGDITITERIIQSFARFGCRDIYMILNHKASMIRSYFSDLRTDYHLHFTTEERFLGTGGGLALLKGKLTDTFLVTNCDILIDDDLSCAYSTHKLHHNIVTVVCSSKTFTLPYGVVCADETGEVKQIEEKPRLQYLVNTGVYVMEPEVLRYISEGEALDMPELISRCAGQGMKVGVFPVSDQAWLDMGQFDSMELMLEHFREKERGQQNE